MIQVINQSAPMNKPINETEYTKHFAIAIRDGLTSNSTMNVRVCQLSRVLWRILGGKL
jgi:hypothetical protein